MKLSLEGCPDSESLMNHGSEAKDAGLLGVNGKLAKDCLEEISL